MRLMKRLVHVLVIVLTLVVGATTAAVIVSQTAWFKNWIRSYIVREANLYLNGTVSIERLGGNLLFGLEMEGIDVSMDGQQVVSVKDVGLDYNIWDFVTKGLSVDNIRLDKPVIYLRRQGDTWTLSRLIKKRASEADRRGPARPVAIEDIGISDGSFVIEDPVGTSGVAVPKRIDHVDAKLAFKYEPVHYSIDLTHISFRGSDPAISLNALSGTVAVRDDTVYVKDLALRTAETSLSVDGAVQTYLTRPVFNLRISSDKLSVPELARLLPALAGVRLQPQFEMKIDGPADRLGVKLNVVSSAGRLQSAIVANMEAPSRSITGDVSVRHLDLGPIMNDPRQSSDITADTRVDVQGQSLTDLRSVRGSVTVDAPRIAAAGYEATRVHGVARLDGSDVAVEARGAAYGATATVKGRVALPEGKQAMAFDLRGRAQHVDFRRLPRTTDVPRAATDINADYHIVGTTENRARLDVRFDPSTIAGARISKDSTAAVVLGEKPIGYTADLTVSDLDVQRVGEQFEIPALGDERFKSSINGRIQATGSVGKAEELDIAATGTLTDSAILGGHVANMTFDASVAHDSARMKAAGDFADVDPAVVSERPELGGRVTGALNIDASVAHVSEGITPGTIEASGTVNLQPSTIGGLNISKATLDAAYRDSSADVRSLEVLGPDLKVQAKGTLALNESGSSSLRVQADTPNLDAIAKLVNEPLAGIATVEATVTGNRRQLEARGRLAGDGVKYRDYSALTVSSDFTARVPELAVADAVVTAATHATFVTLGNQNINQVDGTLGYRQQQLEFDVTATQPERSLGAAGSLLLHPDHQEVHLQKVSLQTAGQTWQLAPGSSPAINYADDDVAVTGVKLVNGDQSIAAEGSYGKPGDELKVTVANVDMAVVDALLLREPQLSGRLNASATVHAAAAEDPEDGSSLASSLTGVPQVDADFQITQGGFRQFRYASFGGTVHSRGKGLTVDTKLEQSPSAVITAKGYLPTAVFKTVSPAEREAAHGAEVAPEDSVDLHIESTPIDLGLVQGLTTELTDVTGTIEANLNVTGPAADPHPTGLIGVQKGAFTVKATGVSYNNVEGKIELQPDRVHIGAISVLDNHFNPLTISGDVAVHERQIGDVQVFIHTDDFKVIDNELGNVRVNTDLRIAGELRAPRVEGDLGVTTGMVNLDRVLAQTGESAYATAPTEYAPGAPGAAAQVPGPFDAMNTLTALSMDVHVTVPNDLIVKASDLQAPGSPVGLGAMTLTLGGDVRAVKPSDGDLSLTGLVNTVRGTYEFRGRRFEIQREGFVRFTGEPLREMDPTLNIAATRLIRAVEARVNVRGTMSKPEFVLSSTPPLEDADILALILFNQPVNELGESQQVDLVQQAQYLAGSTLTSSLSKSVAGALNLDEFDINLAPESGGGPEVRVGQQVGQNLFVSVEQGIGDKSHTNFVLEYELLKWLRLKTNILQGSGVQQQVFQRLQGSGVDLLLFFSY